MENITLCDYIAYQNPKGAMAVLNESGMAYERPRNKGQLASLLKQYLAIGKDGALHKIAQAHPDKELLSTPSYENFSGAIDELLDAPKEKHLNANGGCGCGGGYSNFCAGCGHLSANGSTGGCGGGCSCKGCKKDHGSMGFDGSMTDKVSITNALLAVGVFAILYYVINKKP